MTNWMPNPAAISRPAYLSLAEQFSRAIEAGELPAGTQLLPHRKLADILHLSVQTVSRAYEELIRRGLVQGETGRGSFVLGPGSEANQPYLPERPGEVIDLSILKPVVASMHLERLREGFAWISENMAVSSALSFRPNVVMPHHRSIGAGWLKSLGVNADPSGVILTNGATPAITTAVMSVTPPGSGLAAEELTHHLLKPLCTYLGLHLEGIATDHHGMRPASLDEFARKGLIRAVYLQPNVINPRAIQMPLERRAELVKVAVRYDLAIVENDILNVMIPDRVAPFAALAPERTVYVCGFTKITMPGMRMAYLYSPPRFAQMATNRHLAASWMATPILADLLSHWIKDGTVTQLARWQTQAIGERHHLAAMALGDLMPECHSNSLHLWICLPERWSEEDFVAQARIRGVAVAPGSAFCTSERVRSKAVRVSLGSTLDEDLRRGLTIIASMLRELPEVLLPGI